jgi:hypothetical protein
MSAFEKALTIERRSRVLATTENGGQGPPSV